MYRVTERLNHVNCIIPTGILIRIYTYKPLSQQSHVCIKNGKALLYSFYYALNKFIFQVKIQ